MKKLLSLVLVLVLAFSLVACSKPADTTTTEGEATTEKATMTGDELVALKNDPEQEGKYVIVDVRSPEEYAAGHIEGAKNVFVDDIEKDPSLLEADKDKKIVLYCNSGKKSGKAQDALLAAGYTDVVNADGVKSYEYDLVTE